MSMITALRDLVNAGEYSQAFQLTNELSPEDLSTPEVLYLTGIIHSMCGDDDQGLILLERAYDADFDPFWTHLQIGLLEWRRNRKSHAVAHLVTAYSLQPDRQD